MDRAKKKEEAEKKVEQNNRILATVKVVDTKNNYSSDAEYSDCSSDSSSESAIVSVIYHSDKVTKTKYNKK